MINEQWLIVSSLILVGLLLLAIGLFIMQIGDLKEINRLKNESIRDRDVSIKYLRNELERITSKEPIP